jgi:tetratricopeptide (TPR) repeat protein
MGGTAQANVSENAGVTAKLSPLFPVSSAMYALRLLVALLFSTALILPSGLRGAEQARADFEAAMALFNARRYPEAREGFEKVIAGDPMHAAAHHFLGRTILKRNDRAALPEAIASLARAVELEPNNPVYLGVYGGTSLQLAARTNSLSAARKGREAMEKALTIDPDYLKAREGLFQFYERAPWPIGSSAKARAQLEQIRQRDPDLATVLGVVSKTNAKDYASAFEMCEEILAKNPDNYTALYHYGRTASISGQNLERGLASLQRCLILEPPTPGSPTHSHAWQRIGNILEQLARPAEARQAYEKALQLDPANHQASDALARMK